MSSITSRQRRALPDIGTTGVYDGSSLQNDEVLIKPPEGGLTKPSVIQPNQIRSIDKRRLVEKLGDLSKETVQAFNRALQITLGLVKL